MKNLFIVFEGIDGSGTSTQAGLLRDYFLARNERAIVTSEPSEGPIGNLIRQGLKQRVLFTENIAKFDQQMAYLFAADRHDHLYNSVDGVFKKINDGFHVISTRYFFSSYAYHCKNDSDLKFVKRLNVEFPEPDLVVYINNPIEISLHRINQRSVQDVYENQEKLVLVKSNYEKIFSQYTGNLCEVDGNKDVKSIHSEITEFIEGKFGRG
ncbi:dTMP kinase [Paenibacillus sp. PL2-23]|uniref:dTMP kinase n=1 Tax=Paenibacillus sp. PL2-23 TaxID=2100729 RepID=UPI0030FD0AEC